MIVINLADFFYFRAVNTWMVEEINILSDRILGNATYLISGLALILTTLWVFHQGFRILSGSSREPVMVLVVNMAKISLIVTIACALAIANNPVRGFLTTRLSNIINCVVNSSAGNCSSATIADKVDENLAYMQIAMAAIDAVQVPTGDQATNDAKARTVLMATLGTAGPSMTAGAMLLLYQVAMALLVGFAPLFIMCLMFEQTKQLFHRWLMFTLSTVFSMAVLSAMVSISMKASINTAIALWVAQGVAHLTSLSTEGYSSQALQQGGIGLLMTVLIISAPPMAGMMFNGTLGQFSSIAQVSGGSPQTTHGPQGGVMQGGWYSLPGKTAAGTQPVGNSQHPPHSSWGLHQSTLQRSLGSLNNSNPDSTKYKA